MNLILDELPKTIFIHTEEFNINWDFRTAIRYEMLMLDSTIPAKDKPAKALKLFYSGPLVPADVAEALEGIQWFYTGGEETAKGKPGSRSGERIYSFEHDAPYLLSAFIEQYGIDLSDSSPMHWWKFKALFQGLNEQVKLSKIMGYRSVDLGKAPKEQKEFYRTMKELYKIPLPKTEQEKMDAITEALLNGGNLEGLL